MKTVLITGISRGIGEALARKFLDEGCLVVGTTRDGETSFEHDHLVIYELDLSSTENIRACADKLKQDKRKIDILINSAGVLLDEDEYVIDPEKLRQTLEVNLIGPITFTEQILPLIKSGGHIVNISSVQGSLASTSTSDAWNAQSYKISKAALNMFTRTLAGRMRDRDIAVSSVHPGWVRTNMGGASAPTTPEEAATHIYELAISRPETGSFWHNGKRISW